MITDLFSHKIHSSGDDWPDKLVELATIFSEFDGEVFDRSAIEKQLKKISPRAACAPRDPSKFRDEISAYPAYLGLYKLFPSPEGWRLFLSETAKACLLREEPDVGAFMRLQLSLFQYPNGMGVAYRSFTNKVRFQVNARRRTQDFIRQGVHLSPLRLITAMLAIRAEALSVPIFGVSVSYAEIYALANDPRVNVKALPDPKAVSRALEDFRRGRIAAPKHFESRFHILNHTGLFEIKASRISIRKPESQEDELDLSAKIKAILSIQNQFISYDTVTNDIELTERIVTGEWADYFDAQVTLPSGVVKVLASDIIYKPQPKPGKPVRPGAPPAPGRGIPVSPKGGHEIYPLSERKEYSPSPVKTREKELADPELTRIKRQKQNLIHKELVDKMSEHLKQLGAKPLDNPHIDLYAPIPKDGAYLFEMKSGGENLLSQVRKGLSQLYEYRFRYKKDIDKDVKLCLVVPGDISEIPWIYEYLCADRKISVCWFNDTGQIVFPDECREEMETLVAA